MKLLTKELEQRFSKIGSQDALDENAIVVAKFFTPSSNWTWYATEYDPESGNFFGLVDGFEVELGYFALAELESVVGPLGLGIERDLYWTEMTIAEVRNKHIHH